MSEEEQRRRQVDAGVYWSEATLTQIERVRAENAGLAQLSLSRPWDKPGWEAEYMKPWYRLEADRNLMLVAAYHLVRAVAFLQPPTSEDTSGLDAIRSLGPKLKTLRDCVEHWDESQVEWMPRPPTRLSGQAYRDPTAQAAACYQDIRMPGMHLFIQGQGVCVQGGLGRCAGAAAISPVVQQVNSVVREGIGEGVEAKGDVFRIATEVNQRLRARMGSHG